MSAERPWFLHKVVRGENDHVARSVGALLFGLILMINPEFFLTGQTTSMQNETTGTVLYARSDVSILGGAIKWASSTESRQQGIHTAYTLCVGSLPVAVSAETNGVPDVLPSEDRATACS